MNKYYIYISNTKFEIIYFDNIENKKQIFFFNSICISNSSSSATLEIFKNINHINIFQKDNY